jgi:hypothetical protein
MAGRSLQYLTFMLALLSDAHLEAVLKLDIVRRAIGAGCTDTGNFVFLDFAESL